MSPSRTPAARTPGSSGRCTAAVTRSGSGPSADRRRQAATVSVNSKSWISVTPRSAARCAARRTQPSTVTASGRGSRVSASNASCSRSSPVGCRSPINSSAAVDSQIECRSLLTSAAARPGSTRSSSSRCGTSGHSPSRKFFPHSTSPSSAAAASSSAAAAAESAGDRSVRWSPIAHCSMCTCRSRSPGSSVPPRPATTSASPARSVDPMAATRPSATRTSVTGPPRP